MYLPSFMPTRTPRQHVVERECRRWPAPRPAPTMASEFGILFGIGREHHGDDLGFVQEAFGEQRADRPIDQAAGENFLFRGTSLALDEAARNLAGGVSVLAIIDGEREESGSRLGLVGHTSGDQDHGVTGTNDNSAVRLFGHLTRLEGDLAAAQVYFNYVMHSFLNLQPLPETSSGKS